MATKKIVSTATLHFAAEDHVPFKFDAFSNRVAGAYKVDHVPPGTPVELDEAEADALIAAKLAEIYEEPEVPESAKGGKSAKAPAK